MSTTDHTSDPMGDDLSDRRAAEARATAAEVASRGYRERAEKAERERDAALRTMDEHRCDGQAERAYKRAIHAEAERDALAERAEHAEAALARVRELHMESRSSMSALYPNPLCECGKDYPCPTIAAIGGEQS